MRRPGSGLLGSGKYKEVKIGNQIWMDRNLDVDHFRNGDPIILAKTAKEWRNANISAKPACCYLNYNEKMGKRYGYGKYYNWYAVKDPRGLAPKGWHVSTDEDWDKLTKTAGGLDYAGANLKSKEGWCKDDHLPYTNGIDQYGFNALSAGYSKTVEWVGDGSQGFWWSNKDTMKDYAIYWHLQCYALVDRSFEGKGAGLTVRCVKD